MRKNGKAKAFGLLLLSLGFVAACGNSSIIRGSGGIPIADPPPAKEEIVVWHTYSDEETRVFENELIPLFEKRHPDIAVHPVRQSQNDQLKSTIISRATSGKIPDVVRMDIAWVPELARLGVLYPVSDFSDFGRVKASFRTDTLQTNQYRERFYGLPLDINTKIAIYNRKLLNEAGLSGPPGTLEQLFDAAAKHRMVIGMEGMSPWHMLPYFFGLGGKLTDSGFTRASGYLNSPESIKAMSRLLELYDEKVINPDLLTGKQDRWNGIVKGNILMIDDGPWFYSILTNVKGSKVDVAQATVAAPFPGIGTSIVGGENLVILKDTKHLQASWTFLKWMTSQEAEQRMLRTGLLPTNVNVEIPAGPENDWIAASKKGLEHPLLRPPIPAWKEVESIWLNYATLIFSHKISVESGLNEASAAMDRVLGTSPSR
jgi:multiple sugar transport system substrate-binding protein